MVNERKCSVVIVESQNKWSSFSFFFFLSWHER